MVSQSETSSAVRTMPIGSRKELIRSMRSFAVWSCSRTPRSVSSVVVIS